MAIGLIVGATLLATGLVLLSHLSYTKLNKSVDPAGHDEEGLHSSKPPPEQNDCFLPMCFFQADRVRNHETWVVAFLLSGCTVLLLNLT
jgi:hypothetical protein